MRWKERRQRLDALAHDVTLRERLSASEECDVGELVDRARLLLSAQTLSDNDRLELSNFAGLALDTEADLQHYHSLEASQHSRVDIVQCPAEGRGRVYVRKAISKDFATRMRGQNSTFLERDLLVMANNLSPSPFVPEMLAALHDDDFLNIYLEYMPAGTILDALEDQTDQRFEESIASFWVAETIQAIKWVHGCHCVHRDVKPNNLLLSTSGHIKLTDFGSSAPFEANEDNIGPHKINAAYCTTPAGTVDYIAPDILLAHQAALCASDSDAEESFEAGSDAYGPEVDWWSLAVTFYEMLYGTTPFMADSIRATYELITRSEEFLTFPDAQGVSLMATKFMQSLLTPSDTRLGRIFGAEELKQHPYWEDWDFDKLHRLPSPFEPPSRPLPMPSRQCSIEAEDQLTALFASPGISILRSDAPVALGDAWTGFTYLPPGDAFARQTISDEMMLADNSAVDQSHAFLTPARPTVRQGSESQSRNRDRRALGDNMQALKELADYGALKSAQKRRISTSPLPSARSSDLQATTKDTAHSSQKGSRGRPLSPVEGYEAGDEGTRSPLPSFSLAPRHLSAKKTETVSAPLIEVAKHKSNILPPPPRSLVAHEEVHDLNGQYNILSANLVELEARLEKLKWGASVNGPR